MIHEDKTGTIALVSSIAINPKWADINSINWSSPADKFYDDVPLQDMLDLRYIDYKRTIRISFPNEDDHSIYATLETIIDNTHQIDDETQITFQFDDYGFSSTMKDDIFYFSENDEYYVLTDAAQYIEYLKFDNNIKYGHVLRSMLKFINKPITTPVFKAQWLRTSDYTSEQLEQLEQSSTFKLPKKYPERIEYIGVYNIPVTSFKQLSDLKSFMKPERLYVSVENNTIKISLSAE